MTLDPHKHISVASVTLFLGGLLWIAAFWFPVFETADREIAGYWVFVSGWMGFVVFQFAWYANLLLLIAVILMYSAPVRATIFAALGLLLATQAFWFDVLPETTQSVAITAKGLGFWFWYAGIFLMSVGVFFCLDSDEVTDVIETPEPVTEPDVETEVVPVPAAQAAARLKQSIPAVNPPPIPQVAVKADPLPNVLPVDNPEVPEAVLPEVKPEPLVEEPVDTIASALNKMEEPEPFALNKTDDELEVTVPALTSILHDAVFTGIKKPEQS
uniref:Uncharacterized protein n=1 Tax=uncultured Thiotrichaceae bacterium TaxID=298394 RepID=A0A6S6SQZ2_9GAMM|nr:MAG: Unknown protein [uncultured Thiotrichaceae bacterium]